jgi:hypothetical protein
MANAWDASIQNLYPTRAGGNVAVADVPNGDPYEIHCHVSIGENLNEHVDKFLVRVSVINLTTSTTVQTVDLPGNLTPADDTDFFSEERLSFAAPAQTPGDVLQAVASYTVTAGFNTDVDSAESATFVVS